MLSPWNGAANRRSYKKTAHSHGWMTLSGIGPERHISRDIGLVLRNSTGYRDAVDDCVIIVGISRSLPMTIKVLLAAPDGLFADAFCTWLSKLGADVQVIRRRRSSSSTHPIADLTLLDLDSLSEEDALATVQNFCGALQSSPLVAMASCSKETFVSAVKAAGASAYLCKSTCEREALALLGDVMQQTKRPHANQGDIPRERTNVPIPYGLTRREMEILELACGGMSNLAIGKRCGITEGVVKLHLHHAYQKLGVQGRLQAVRIVENIEGIRAIRMQRSETGAGLIDWLLPHMIHETRQKGHFLFRKGDPGAALYYVQKGRVRLHEIDVEMSPGDLFGEIGIFAPGHTRTCSARCETQVQLFRLSADDARRLCFENPQFAFYVIGLVADRLVEERTQSRQG